MTITRRTVHAPLGFCGGFPDASPPLCLDTASMTASTAGKYSRDTKTVLSSASTKMCARSTVERLVCNGTKQWLACMHAPIAAIFKRQQHVLIREEHELEA